MERDVTANVTRMYNCSETGNLPGHPLPRRGVAAITGSNHET